MDNTKKIIRAIKDSPNSLISFDEINCAVSGIEKKEMNKILSCLENEGKILIGEKGILWIYNPSSKLRKAVREGTEV